MKNRVVIIDYGVGNLLSVSRSFERLGISSIVSSNPKEILTASHVVLPGVGAFPRAMEKLGYLGLIPVVKELAMNGTPLLAICLGMQLLMDESEEFKVTSGLGLIPGKVVSIPKVTTDGHPLITPHVGWSPVFSSKKISNLEGTYFANTYSGKFFYFVHSFAVTPKYEKHVLGTTEYGGHSIVAAISSENIVGYQFHPEKSGAIGLELIKSFISR